MKILHLADIHANDTDIDEISKCLDFVIETANNEKPDLAVIAGDLTNSHNCKLDSGATRLLFRFIDSLSHIAPVAIVTGTPSHDGMSPEIFRHIDTGVDKHRRIWVSSQPEQIYLKSGTFTANPIPSLDAVISLCPAVTKQYFQYAGASIAESDKKIGEMMGSLFAGFGTMASPYWPAKPHILIGHWQVGGAFVSETQQLTGVDIEISRQHLELAYADLYLLGHIHYAQEVFPHCFYSGSIYRQNWGELGKKGFYIHKVHDRSPEIIESKFVETPTRKLLKLYEDFTPDGFGASLDKFDTALFSFSADDYKDAFVRFEIVIFRDEIELVNKQELESFFLSAGAKSVDIKIIPAPRENVRSERLLRLETLREKLLERATIKNEPMPDDGVLEKADLLEAYLDDHSKITEMAATI